MNKNVLRFAILSLCLIFSSVFAASKAEKEEVQNAYYAWCETIGTAKGNANDVVKFYAPNAILLPTLSHKILRNTNGGMNEYFTHLTSYPNIKCTPKELITHLEGHVAVNSGLYSFSFTDKEGHEKVIPARFTFVYKKIDHQWMIIKHHSSKMP